MLIIRTIQIKQTPLKALLPVVAVREVHLSLFTYQVL